MKKFRYPLERLKQVREQELSAAADHLRQVLAEIKEVETHIAEKVAAIQKSQRGVVETESKSGTVRPDLRRMAASYVQSVQLEQDKLNQVLSELQQTQQEAHAALIEKKQAVKMLENHEVRLSTQHQLAMQERQQKEDDELWLSRQQDASGEFYGNK